MKMLGFMIAMTLVYWVMATYAHSIIATVDPCPSAEFVSAGADHLSAADADPAQISGGEEAAVKLRGRWSVEGDYQMIDRAGATAPSACAG